MDVVSSFIESVSTTKNHEERTRTYQNFQQKIRQIEGVHDEEAPPEKSMLALARVMNGDAESRIAHLQKACIGVLEMLLVTDLLSEASREVFIDSLLREPSTNEAHKLAFKAFKNKVSSEIKANILNPNVIFGTRHEQYKTAIEAISADLSKETAARFLATKILPAMYQRHMDDNLRETAIELATHFDVNLIHLSTSEQDAFTNTVMNKYCGVVTNLMEADYENWHKLWIFIVKFCGLKFHSVMVLANRLLRVIEEAFRCRTVPKILKGYECWLAVIENASLSKKHLCSNKQLKLLMTPLKAKLSKEPAVLLRRIDVFVRLLSTMQDMAVLCLKDFLEVCFGPFDDSGARPQANRRIPEMCKRSTVALFDILGHGHCQDESCVRDSFIEFKEPLMNPANFAKCFAILIDSVVECCIVLPSWNSSATTATVVVRCLWFSLLQLCKASDNDIKCECWTRITNKLRALSEKIADNEFCSTILGGFVEASAMLEITALNEVMFDISMNLFCRASEPVSYNQDKIERVIGDLLESDNAKCSKIAAGYLNNDTNPAKMSVLCNVWLKCPQNDVSFLLWPIRHLKHFPDLKVFEKTWKENYAKYSSESESIKMGFLQKLEGLFAENPLLSPGIILILHSVSSCDSIATSDFVTKSMRLLGSVLTYPNLSDEDIKTSISIVILHLGYIGLPLQEGVDEAINKLCISVQHLITVHKNISILPTLEDFLKDQPKTCLAKFAHHLVPFLETVMLNDDTALNICGKLLEVLDVKESEQKQSTPKLASRSLRMLNMANKSPSNAPSGLRLFSKAKDTPPPKTSSPSTRSKLIMQNTSSPARKKVNVSIDEERSSDFVKIDTPVRFEPKKLSEHQKEVMLKRREDIPALYQDLSQSQDWSLSQDSSKSAQAPAPLAKSSNNNNNESTAMKVSSFKKPRIGKKQRTVKTDLDSSLDSSMDENSGGSGGGGGSGSERVSSPVVASKTATDTSVDVTPLIAKETEHSDNKPSVDESVIEDAEDVPRPSSRTKRIIKEQAETPTQVRKSLRQQLRKGKEDAENTQAADAENRSSAPAVKTAVSTEKSQTPVHKAQAPVLRARTPVPKAQTPVLRAQTPVSKVQTPVPNAQASVPKVQASVPKTKTLISSTQTPVLTEKTEIPSESTPVSKAPVLVEKTETPVDVVKIGTPLRVDSPLPSGSARLISQRKRSTSVSTTPLKGLDAEETPRKIAREAPSEQKEHVEDSANKELDVCIERKLPKRSLIPLHGVPREKSLEMMEHVGDKAEVEVVQQVSDAKAKVKRESLGKKRKHESSSPEQSRKRANLLRRHVDLSILPMSAEKRKIKLKKIEEFWPGIRKSEIVEPEATEGEVEPSQVDVATTGSEAEGAALVPQIEESLGTDEKRSEFLEHLQLKSKVQVEEEKASEALRAAQRKRRSPRKSPSPGKRPVVGKRKRPKDPFLVSRKKSAKAKFCRTKRRREVRGSDLVGHVTAETSEEEKGAAVATSPKAVSPKRAASPRAASRSELASPAKSASPRVASTARAASSSKPASPPKASSKAVSSKTTSPRVASPPKATSPLKTEEVDEETAKRILVERLLVQAESALKYKSKEKMRQQQIQENRAKFDSVKQCHVKLEEMRCQVPSSLPTSPVKLPEMRQRARSVDHIREVVDEIKRKLRPKSFPEDAKKKTTSRTISFSKLADSTLGSQDIIESSQSTVVEMPAPAKRVTRQSTSPKSSPKTTTSNDPSPKTVSPSVSVADTESCESVVKSLTPKETTPPGVHLTSSERLMADMSTETMHSESLTLTPPSSKSKEQLPGSPVGCDTPELVSEFLQGTSDISPICTPHVSFEEAKDAVAAAAVAVVRPQSLLPVKTYNAQGSARGTRLLQMVNPESVLKKDPPGGIAKIRLRKIEQPKRKEQYEILTFSREIPSPLSVPGNSILKRRLHHSDDIHMNPPKRKRVNFSDPAITKKKIYLTDFPDLDNSEEVTINANSDFDRLLNGIEQKECNPDYMNTKKSILDTIKYFCDKKIEDDNFTATIVKMTELLEVSTVKEIIVEFLSVVNSKLKNGMAAALTEEADKQVILETKLVPLLKTTNDLETYVDIFIFFLKKLTFKDLQDFIGQLRVLLGNEFEQHFVSDNKENGTTDVKEITVINKEPATAQELLDSAKRIVENLSVDDKREFFSELMRFTAANCVADDQTVAMQMQCLLDLQRRKMEQ